MYLHKTTHFQITSKLHDLTIDVKVNIGVDGWEAVTKLPDSKASVQNLIETLCKEKAWIGLASVMKSMRYSGIDS